jgi:multicomponent Na+:H+ antiporter subunit E
MNYINFIRYLAQILFRLAVWSLLTANFKISNLIIGIVISVILPTVRLPNLKINLMITEFLKTIIAFPKAIQESIYLIFLSNKKEVFINQESSVPENGSQFINFLDLFRITLTPLSLVTKRKDKNNWRVHIIEGGK